MLDLELMISMIDGFIPNALKPRITNFLKQEGMTGESGQAGHEVSCPLDQFMQVRELITTLQIKGPHHFIETMEGADETILSTLAKVVKDPNLEALMQLFLLKTAEQLAVVDKQHLVRLVQHSKTQSLNVLEKEASNQLSLQLIRALRVKNSTVGRLEAIKKLLNHYPLVLPSEVVWIILYFYRKKFTGTDFDGEARGLFISIVYDLLKNQSIAVQRSILSELDEGFLYAIVHCCNELNLMEGPYQPLAKTMLLLLYSTAIAPSSHYIQALWAMLQIKSVILFGNSQTQAWADSINSSYIRQEIKQRTQIDFEYTPDPSIYLKSPWMISLLVSPHFMANANTLLVQKIAERYRLLLAISSEAVLKDLMYIGDGDVSLGQDILTCLRFIDRQLTQDPSHIEAWLAKKRQVSQFAIRYCLQNLWVQLQNNCEKLKTTEPKVAELALTNLHLSGQQDATLLRHDALFSLIELLYAPLQQANTPLQQWFIANASWIKGNKKDIAVFDSKKQCQGYLTATNQVYTFIDHQPILQTKIKHANPELFNLEGHYLGTLTDRGALLNGNEVQKNAAVELLNLMSDEELQSSPLGLNLLIHQVLGENTLSALLTKVAPERHRWLREQCIRAVVDNEGYIPPETLSDLVNHLNEKEVFHWLEQIKEADIALIVFHNMLGDEQKRNAWLEQTYQSCFVHCLARTDDTRCLVEYLTRYYQQPWFEAGLSCFAAYAREVNKSSLLSDALTQLEVTHCPVKSAVLKKCLHSEKVAALIFDQFLHIEPQTPVQCIQSQELEKVSSFFGKEEIMEVMAKLCVATKMPDKQYKLILYLLHVQKQRLFFCSKPLPVAAQTWSIHDLRTLAAFVQQHWGQGCTYDLKKTLGYYLLGELLFRGAHAGDITLLTNPKLPYQNIAISPSWLRQLLGKFWLPIGLHNVRNSLQASSSLLKPWEGFFIQNQTNGQTAIPVLCVFLLNYVGDYQNLFNVLKQYFKSTQEIKKGVYPISGLLHQFPERSVCEVIFDALVATAKENPEYLDHKIVSDMANYLHKKCSLKDPQDRISPELRLVFYLGQQKLYPVVEWCCSILTRIASPLDTTRLLKAKNEARVEQYLSQNFANSSVVKSIVRWWHYGISHKKATGLVRWCDVATAAPWFSTEEKITIPPIVYNWDDCLSFEEKKKALINFLLAVEKSFKAKIEENSASNGLLAFLADPGKNEIEPVASDLYNRF